MATLPARMARHRGDKISDRGFQKERLERKKCDGYALPVPGEFPGAA